MDLKFRCKLFLVLSYFDEVFGSQVIQAEPSELNPKILHMMMGLMDIVSLGHRNSNMFIYADREFVSQNVARILINPDARGSSTEFLISLIVVPSYSHVLSAIAMDWNSLLRLEEEILPELELFCQDGNLECLREAVKERMKMLRTHVVETLNFELDILSPESYIIE